DDPRRRHHVRCWRSARLDDAGRPMWLGAATFDTRVGFSHDTGQVTHHIAPEIDADRDLLIADLRAAGALDSAGWVDDFQPMRAGRNGGGDPWQTDRRLAVGVLGQIRETK
ncbi:MAG: LssY C-terminal domain-containing protein, partial [Tepidisphaeraceae bacterium]